MRSLSPSVSLLSASLVNDLRGGQLHASIPSPILELCKMNTRLPIRTFVYGAIPDSGSSLDYRIPHFLWNDDPTPVAYALQFLALWMD